MVIMEEFINNIIGNGGIINICCLLLLWWWGNRVVTILVRALEWWWGLLDSKPYQQQVLHYTMMMMMVYTLHSHLLMVHIWIGHHHDDGDKTLTRRCTLNKLGWCADAADLGVGGGLLLRVMMCGRPAFGADATHHQWVAMDDVLTRQRKRILIPIVGWY